MDFETVLINNVHTPYLLSWFDGTISKSYFIDSLENLEANIQDMILRAMKDLNIKKYEKHIIYLHNLSRFDGYFLIKYLIPLGFVDPRINNGKIISLKFRLKDSDFTLTFNDSFLLLPASLKNLCNSFNVNTVKSIFPFLLSDINYVGEVPGFKYFTNLALEDYNNYKENYFNKIWSFKEEAEKYCIIDCISLHEILVKFNSLIFNKFQINISRYPTLSSLTFGIFRTHYVNLPDNKKDGEYNALEKLQIENSIHKLTGSIAEDIRMGYTGGAVDMYIPTIPKGSIIKEYDVNSLYPSQMKEFDMPVGSPSFFNGNILEIDKDAFGFFFCKITTPDLLNHPILQTHVKTDSGVRTIAPLGTWTDMLFSEEIKNALKFGYKFDILWGYNFKRENIFDNYVSSLYKLRLEYSKSDPMNYIAKLLMNSLYGRFGMNDDFTFMNIINKKDYLEFEKNNKDGIIDVLEIGDYFLIKTVNINHYSNITENNELNINVAVSAAITSYSRIYMSQFKNNPLFKLYYSDTDSIYIDRPLPLSFVSDKILGKLKLERICNNGVFLAPKVYGLIEDSGNKIIKVKGLGSKAIKSLSFNNLETLLFKDKTLEFDQIKWFKSLVEGNITLKEQIYTLKVTDNKRNLIYYNGKLVGTTPYIINENKEILNK